MLKNEEMNTCYTFDEISIAPNWLTIDPDDVDISWRLRGKRFSIPILASAIDSISNVDFAVKMSTFGGFAVINLEGINTRFERPEEVVGVSNRNVARLYNEPIREDLISKRILEVKERNATAVVSCTPANAKHFASIAKEVGVDIFVVQATVTSAYHDSSKYSVNLSDVKHILGSVPLIVGNCASYQAAYDLLNTGADALLVGIGPGYACTSSTVLGIGVPQATATKEVANARIRFYRETDYYAPIITDGGLKNSGDICKAIACGADAVMCGSLLAQASETPGKGKCWGMSVMDQNLPRGIVKTVLNDKTLENVLHGPARIEDVGKTNLVGALKNSMGVCGASNIKEMQNANVVII